MPLKADEVAIIFQFYGSSERAKQRPSLENGVVAEKMAARRRRDDKKIAHDDAKVSEILDGSFIKFSTRCGGFARRRADVIEKGRPENAAFSLSACLGRNVSDELCRSADSPARMLLNVSPDIQLILKPSAFPLAHFH